MRLRNLILLVVLPLVVAPIVLLGSLGYIALRDRTEQSVQNQVNTLLDQVAIFLDAKLRAVQADARVLASSGLVERYVLTSDELDRYELFQPPLLKMFGEQQQVDPDYFEIRILLPDGHEDVRVTTQQVANLSEAEGDSAYFQALSAAPADAFSTFMLNPDNGWPVLLVSKRLRLKDRSVDPLATKARVRGYLIITARLATLERQARNNRIGAAGILLFADGQGQILVHPDPLRVGTRLPAPLFSHLLTSLHSGRLKPLAGGGSDLLWQARQVHDDLYAIVSFPKQELATAGRRLGLSVLAITFVALLATAISLFLLLERTVNAPIQRLSRAAREIGKGNLEPAVPPGGAREIAELTRSFQAMGRDLRDSDERIRFLAFHDPITGLPNRKLFIEHLHKALERANLRGTTMAVLLLNLDDFRRVNESQGRAAGDALLKEMAGRLSRNLRSEGFSAAAGPGRANDLVAHMGGDEFAVLLTDVGSALDAGIFARRLLEDLARPCVLADTQVRVSASLAITIFLDDGQDAATLLRHAHIAMYRAKDRGKNNFQYYSEPLNAMVAAHFEMERRLRDALAQERLRLFFQPVVDREDRRVLALEALLHWDDPELQAIPPRKLVEIAERSDLIDSLGAWVLEHACRWGKSWQDRGLPAVSLCVKIFESQVNRGDLSTSIRESLELTNLPAHLLNLQIAESCVLAAKERAIDLLADTRASGIRISIDHVGTGYASLNYLRRLPIDSLKIDRGFLEQAAAGTQDSIILDAIITMGHNLGLQVVAEGVETPEQLQFLEDRGCDLFQGSLFGPPLPGEEVPRLLSRTQEQAPETPLTCPEARSTASPASPPTRRRA